jgi:hypothetical protein
MKVSSRIIAVLLSSLPLAALAQQGEHSGGRIKDRPDNSHIEFQNPCVQLARVEDRRKGCQQFCEVPGKFKRMRAANGKSVNCPVAIAYKCDAPLPVACRAKGGR